MENRKQDFVKLLSEHRGIIHKVCHVYQDSAEDRQDLFQEIVLQLWRSYPGFKGQSTLSTWLYRVALNTAISAVRQARPQAVGLGSAGNSVEGSNLEARTDNRELLRVLINSLNKVEKSLILLYLEEKSYDEIAEITGMTRSNVSVRLVRIRKKLAELYKTEKI